MAHELWIPRRRAQRLATCFEGPGLEGLGFEAPGASAPVNAVCHYFAYGSNMNPARVEARGLRVTTVRSAWLDGVALSFDKQSAEHPHSGHANIGWSRDDRVEGVLYGLPDADEIRRMDPFERAPINYSREVVMVATEAGPVAAWTYFANAAVRVAGLQPEAAYLAHLLLGRPWLSAAYGERLACWPCVEPPEEGAGSRLPATLPAAGAAGDPAGARRS